MRQVEVGRLAEESDSRIREKNSDVMQKQTLVRKKRGTFFSTPYFGNHFASAAISAHVERDKEDDSYTLQEEDSSVYRKNIRQSPTKLMIIDS
jgi:hypothetical protein